MYEFSKKTLITDGFTNEEQSAFFEVRCSVKELISSLNRYIDFISALPNQGEIIQFKRKDLAKSKELLDWLSPLLKKYPGCFAAIQWESKQEISKILYDCVFNEIQVKEAVVRFSLLDKYLNEEISIDQFITHSYTKDFINSFSRSNSLELINNKHREWVAYVKKNNSQIK